MRLGCGGVAVRHRWAHCAHLRHGLGCGRVARRHGWAHCAHLRHGLGCGRVAYSGAHDATIAAVASGKVQGGALNISVWEKFVADKKVDTGKVRVIFTTPPYYDYNWSVHADMPAAQREKLAAALLKLDRATPQGKEVLDLQRATRFVPTKADNYKGIEAAAKTVGGTARSMGLQVVE